MTEGLLPDQRANRHSEVRDYLPNPLAGWRQVGLPTDDSQMAFWTLEQLLIDHGLVPKHLAERFAHEEIFGIGQTVYNFVQAYRYGGKSWREAGQPSAGNGALMRIAPLIIPHLGEPSPALWADAALGGMITHNDRASNAACIAFIHLLWEILGLRVAPEPTWWVDTFSHAASQLEGDTDYRPRKMTLGYEGPIWRFAEREVRTALVQGIPAVQACDGWYSGAYLMETIPSVLYILAQHGHDPEEAIVRAVNDTWDNDTVAAIVGAAVGALHGRRSLPPQWIEGLLGRTRAEDDGRVFELIRQAEETFFPSK
jgi:ADP-ribosylglycohydrolase